VTSGQITVIDATKLDRNSVFFATPIHKELCKKRAFTSGAWLYHGSHEFMVYHKVWWTFPYSLLKC
jgi:hypothetical protein